jgi:tetratricopeptide (TPR) repeat protein
MSFYGKSCLKPMAFVLAYGFLVGLGLIASPTLFAQKDTTPDESQPSHKTVQGEENARVEIDAVRDADKSLGSDGSKSFQQFKKDFFLDIAQPIPDPESTEEGVWLRNELERHRRAVAGKQFDLIVLPMQLNRPYFDRVSRMMPARLLANELKSRSGLKIMSPELASRRLGGRRVRFEDAQVWELAQQSEAKVLHLLATDMSPKGVKGLQLAVVETDANGMVTKSALREFEYPPEETPIDMSFRRHVRSIVDEMYGTSGHQRAKATLVTQGEFKLPEQIDGLVDVSANPLEKAASLQLIALLTPELFEYERRRLFERSLLAVEGLDTESSYLYLIQARAYFYLSRRPVAMTFLESPQTPAERALKEFLNGNYPELSALVKTIEEPVFQVMSSLELKSLGHSYKKGSKQVIEVPGASNAWKFMINTAGQDGNIWFAPNNSELFSELTGLFPAFDDALAQKFGGRMVSGADTGGLGSDKLYESVFASSWKGSKPLSCCTNYEGYPEISDIWLLYRNLATANLLRKLERSVNVHASYNTASKYVESLNSLLVGQPTYTRLHAETLAGLSEKAEEAERAYLRKKAFKLARDVARQSQTVDKDTLRAWDLMEELMPSVGLVEWTNALNEFNLSSFIGSPTIFEKKSRFGGLTTLPAYSNTGFHNFEYMARAEGWDIERTARGLKGRYNGHPKKGVYLAQRYIEAGEDEKAIDILEQAIAKGEDSWEVFHVLGSQLISDGRYAEAKDVYLKYPFFTELGGKSPVTVSNKASKAGDRLFWLGLHEEAVPLYEVAGGMETGSAAHFSSIQRLAMIERDFRTAIEYAYRRGRRYNSKFGYRDYLAFLHLVGAHEEAEAGFKALVPRFRTPELWTSQFVGQRMKNFSKSDYADWMTGLLQGSDNHYVKHNALRYLFRQSVIDREAEPECLETVKSFNTPGFTEDAHKNQSSQLWNIFTPEMMNDLSSRCDEKREPCGKQALAPEYTRKDYIPAFMDAYQDLFAGRYTGAMQKFVALDKVYPALVGPSARETLPYLLMAASKVAPAEALEASLKTLRGSLTRKGEAYELALSESVLLTALGKNEDALEALTRAYHHRPHTQSRHIYTWYEITSIAEWLSQQTGDAKYTQQALAWAKRYQVIQPQFAWAFAFEALYAEDEKERIKAAAYAQYLDPQSAWLSKVPEEIRAKAVERWPEINPFVIKQEQDGGATAEI